MVLYSYESGSSFFSCLKLNISPLNVIITFSSSVDGNATSAVDGNALTVTPDVDFNGDISVTVSLTDGEFTDTADVTITITAVNDAPILTAVLDPSFDEDTIGTLSLSASDVDEDSLTYSISEGAEILPLLNGSDITFSTPLNFNGSEEFVR